MERRGRQTPTFQRVGTYDRSDGPEAVALFEHYGVGFEDAGGADATLIEACALALWQAKTTKRRPGRKAVVY